MARKNLTASYHGRPSLRITGVDLLALREQIRVRGEQRFDSLCLQSVGHGLALLAYRGEFPALGGQAATIPLAMVLQCQHAAAPPRAGLCSFRRAQAEASHNAARPPPRYARATMTARDDAGAQARHFVRSHRLGVLSTLSQRQHGIPYGSIAPFVLDHAGCALVLVSSLAEHTRNLEVDARCSLLVHPCAADPQAAGRVTLLGRASRGGDKTALGPRYLRYVPGAAGHFDLPDFHFWRIIPEAIRSIAGFGRARWVDAAAFAPPPNRVGEAEEAIVAQWNMEHVAALRACARRRGVRDATEVRLLGIDVDGFDLYADGQTMRVDFAHAAVDGDAVRAALQKHCHEET